MKRMLLISGLLLAILCGCKNSPRTQASDESIIKAKEVIQNTMSETNKMCPINFGGCIMESVNYDYVENEINYNYAAEQINDNDNISNIKEGMLISLKGEYVANPQAPIFYEAIIKARTKMIYNYYTKDGKTRKVVLLPSEIESSIHN